MCSDCEGGVSCGDTGERDELRAHLVDDGTISAEAAREERCRERGICSDSACDQAIDGWCEGCGVKLCAGGLLMHATVGCAVARKMESEQGDGQGH